MEERQDQGQQPGWGEQGAGQQMPQPGPYPYQGAQQYYRPPAAAPVKARPRWKTPVIAAVALVVGIAIGAAAGGGSKNSPSTGSASGTTASSSPAQASTPAAPASSAAPAAPVASVVLTLSGEGQKSSKQFSVAADWSLNYTYDCSNMGFQGNLIVTEHGGHNDSMPMLNQLGIKGGDTTYQHDDAGTHFLAVDSECKWTMKVTSGDKG